MSAVELVHRTAHLGLTMLQICENVVAFDRFDPAQIRVLRTAADAAGIRLELGCRLESRDRIGYVEALRAALAQASALGSMNLRVVPAVGEDAGATDFMDTLCASLSAVVPDCAQHQVRLAVENYLDLPDAVLAGIVEGIASEWVGVTLDTANSVGQLRNPMDTTQMLAPYALGIHLKDYRVVRSPVGYRITGAPLGDGQLDVEAILRAIGATGRRPPLLLELWVEAEADRPATLRKEEIWVERSVVYARRQLEAIKSKGQ